MRGSDGQFGCLAAAPSAEKPLTAEEKFIVIDGCHTRYLQAGSGSPLVLIHGMLGYSFSWRFCLPELARYATVYALDLPGTGLSDRLPQPDCRLSTVARRVAAFMDTLGLRHADVLGTSHGGGVVMLLAAERPDLVRRLLLVAPANPWSTHGRVLAPLLGSAAIAPLFRLVAPLGAFTHTFFLRRLFGDPRRIPPDALEGYRRPFAVPGLFAYLTSVLSGWTADMRSIASSVERISVPTLVLTGDHDAAVPHESALELHRHLPGSKFVLMKNVGHLPYEESPQEFVETVVAFLRESDAA